MSRARTAVTLRVPTKREDKSEYDFAGEFHWTDWVDTPVRQYNSIWNIPLSAFGDEIQFDDGVLAPLCKNSMAQEFYLIRFDADYLKERFYREWVEALNWKPETVKNFFQINEQWFTDRIQYFQRQELREQAEHIATLDPQKRDTEFWLNQLLGIKDETSKYETEGVLEKIGAEYFLLTQEKYRYKVKTILLDTFRVEDQITEDLVGKSFLFNSDPNIVPPKSRGAKGWVSELCVKEV